jgi:hypothetical protein
MEELLKQLLESQKHLLTEIASIKECQQRIEIKMDTEFKNLKESDSAILGLIEKTYRKTEQIDAIADDINFLLQRNAKHDNEIRELRKAL